MATQTSKINLNWASDVIGLMKSAGSDFNSPDIMLGEVVTPPPALSIKVGNIVLYKEQLLVSDYLLKDYKRAYYMDGSMHFKAKADTELTGMTKPTETPAASVPQTWVGDHGPHSHSTHTHPEHDHALKEIDVTTTKEDFYAHGDGKDPVADDDRYVLKAEEKYFWFKDTLKAKDLVSIQQLPNTHYFLVMNRLIRMEDVSDEA